LTYAIIRIGLPRWWRLATEAVDEAAQACQGNACGYHGHAEDMACWSVCLEQVYIATGSDQFVE
jgi:hypothetical protein